MTEFLHGLPLLLKAALLGLVEGLTEFLPISSTGHLILAGSLLGLHDDKTKLFDVAIQTGAMLAVIWHYRRRIADTVAGLGGEPRARRFAANILIAFLPAAALGVMFGSAIKAHLFRPVPVAIAFVVGGLVILWVERGRAARIARIDDVDGRMPDQRLPVVADMGGARGERGLDAGCGAAFGLPADAGEIGASADGRQVGDRHQMHAQGARHLGQIHGTELAGADQPDAHRPALRGTLQQPGM
jgi:hypothetical protein